MDIIFENDKEKYIEYGQLSPGDCFMHNNVVCMKTEFFNEECETYYAVTLYNGSKCIITDPNFKVKIIKAALYVEE